MGRPPVRRKRTASPESWSHSVELAIRLDFLLTRWARSGRFGWGRGPVSERSARTSETRIGTGNCFYTGCPSPMVSVGLVRRMSAPVVTIDGPVGSGKSTVGQLLAERRGYLCLDSGLFYRAAALAALRASATPSKASEVLPAIESLNLEFRPVMDGAYRTRVLWDGEDVTEGVYSAAVEAIVSDVSRLPEVRAHLLGDQRRTISQGGVVALGRDIGTVVWPEAELKLYLDASLETRALRKWEQRTADGECIDLTRVRALLEARDRIDSTRADAPLSAAADAVRIDSEDSKPEEVVAQIEVLLRERGFCHGC